MKEIKREVQRIEEVITYESTDGKEFKTKEDCLQWEKSYESTIRTSFKKIPHIETNCDSAYIVNPSDEVVVILKPRNMDDILVINAYGKMIDSSTEPLTQEDIGKVLMVHTGYDEDWFMVYNMDMYMEDIKRAYDSFKTRLEKVEKEN